MSACARLGFGVNGAGESVLGGVGVLKETSYDSTSDIFCFFPAYRAAMRPISISA